MQIFATYTNPVQAAKHLCETHVSSQLKEAAQILATCFTLEQLAQPDCPRNQKGQPRKHGYYNHPCCTWARASKGNMRWLLDHALEICHQFHDRKNKHHFSREFILWANKNIDKSVAPDGIRIGLPYAITDTSLCCQVKGFDKLSTTEKYRQYYRLDKKHLHKWTKNKPNWL